tara:strand:+ start:506 stop:1351 length:846 start_codon:yes stop_codon:yes gene_type:complete
MAKQDPHISFAHGGSADFHGDNETFYAILSAPGVNFAAFTQDSKFMLPRLRPQLVYGSFFTKVSLVLRGHSMKIYGISSDSNVVGFDVFDLGKLPNSDIMKLNTSKRSVWSEWWHDGIRVLYKQSTIFARANGWEVNCTRKPIFNQLSGSSKWHFDISMRILDGRTGFESSHGLASKTCFPHGLIGQSYDMDDIAVDGNKDDYTYDATRPVVTTRAQAEGAIEGVASDYRLRSQFEVEFVFGRFNRTDSDRCAARDVASLTGRKRHRTALLYAGSSGLPPP